MHEGTTHSISAFFPCYNDKGTIASMVAETQRVLEKITDDFEIIVIDDGSSDGSRELLKDLQQEYSRLRLVFHDKNRGYGGALRSGFSSSTKDLIFYTDGDAQYDVRELPKLYERMSPDIDIVNGYKIKRSDPFHRVVIGLIYQHAMKIAFGLRIRDVDCDFRLMRREAVQRLNLKSNTGTICVELIKKLEDSGARFIEVGVSHYHRTYGKSQFFKLKRLWRTFVQLSRLWFELVILKRPG
ncbi:MAG: glycosyltransferase family 2 protein [Patescibacteria group bacterium]